MLMALLLGIALQFLSAEETCRAGIEFTVRSVLRFGVALLGARISLELLAGLGLGGVAVWPGITTPNASPKFFNAAISVRPRPKLEGLLTSQTAFSAP
ncbi:putative sulfate exporter family transporter [Leisingera daeponensis]|uniref:putative sulfate exporter family transporter n=1 Tax=Leisingera daeponensis TaxID=405746 RepID=UPI0039655F96